jgi:hypothetical protein
MKLNRAALLLLLLPILGATACSDDDDDDSTGVSGVAKFQGTWDASSIRYTSTANQSRTLDITQVCISGSCGDLNMIIAANGTFSGTFKLPVGTTMQTIPVTGSVALLSGNNQAHVDFIWPSSIPAGSEPVADFDATYTLSGNTLTFTRQNATFQFPGQAAAESSVLVVTMARAST